MTLIKHLSQPRNMLGLESTSFFSLPRKCSESIQHMACAAGTTAIAQYRTDIHCGAQWDINSCWKSFLLQDSEIFHSFNGHRLQLTLSQLLWRGDNFQIMQTAQNMRRTMIMITAAVYSNNATRLFLPTSAVNCLLVLILGLLGFNQFVGRNGTPSPLSDDTAARLLLV